MEFAVPMGQLLKGIMMNSFYKKYIIENLYWIWTEDRLGLCMWQKDYYIDAYRIAYSLSWLYPEEKITDYEWFCNKVTFLNTDKGASTYREGRHLWNYVENKWYYETEKSLYERIKEIKEYILMNKTVFD